MAGIEGEKIGKSKPRIEKQPSLPEEEKEEILTEEEKKLPERFVSDLRIQQKEINKHIRDRNLKELLDENGIDCLHGLRAELEKLPKDEFVRVLDLGCGEGVAVKELQKKYQNWEIHGLDLLPEKITKKGGVFPRFILKFQKLFGKRDEVKKEAIVQGEVSILPYKSDQFDLLYSKYAYSYFPDKIKAVIEALRVVKPGGVIILQASPGNAYEFVEGQIFKAINVPKELQAKGIKGISKEDIEKGIKKETTIRIRKSKGDDERAKLPFKFLGATGRPILTHKDYQDYIDSFYERVPEK